MHSESQRHLYINFDDLRICSLTTRYERDNTMKLKRKQRKFNLAH